MQYKEIPTKYRVQLKNSIEKVVFEVLDAAAFYFSDDFSDYDDSIVEIVRHELLKKNLNKNSFIFVKKSTTNEFRLVLKDVVEKMRQKQPSKSQLKFFLTMKYETGDDMVPSDDYLIFCRQIERLKSKSFHFGLASRKSIEKYNELSKSKGLGEIDMDYDWTKIQVRNGIEMLNQS